MRIPNQGEDLRVIPTIKQKDYSIIIVQVDLHIFLYILCSDSVSRVLHENL